MKATTGSVRPSLRYRRLTPAAWRLGWIGLGLVAAAVNTGNNLIYLLVGLLLAALPISHLLSRLNLAPLEVELRLPRHARAGSPFTVEVTLHHRGRRRHARGIALRVHTERGACYGPAWIERVEAGTTTRVRLDGRHALRGAQRIVGVELTSSIPLGFLRATRRWPVSLELLVLPAGAATPPAITRGAASTGREARSDRVHGNEFDGLRRGSETDDARRIDWKSTARRGVLMLRETRGEARPQLDQRLTTRIDGNSEAAHRELEQRIVRLAGEGRYVLEQDGIVRLTVDGRETATYSGRRGLVGLLSRLARVQATDPQGRPLAAPAVRRSKRRPAPRWTDANARATPPGRAMQASATAALAVGLTALVAYEGIGPIAFAVLIGSLGLSSIRPGVVARPDGTASKIWRVAGMLALVGFLADLGLRGNPLVASLLLVMFITLYQIYNGSSAKDDRLNLLLSLLQLVLAAALTTQVSFALPLLAWILVAVHALIASASTPPQSPAGWRPRQFDPPAHRLRYGRASAATACGIVGVGLLFFLILPHIGTGTYQAGRMNRQRVSGFSDRATLGDIGRIKLDDSPVMEIEARGRAAADPDLKWRGVALERFDGRTWSRATRDVEWLTADQDGRFYTGGGENGTGGGEILTQHVRLEAGEMRILFAAEQPQRVTSRDFQLMTLDGAGALEARTRRGRPLSYSVTSRVVLRDEDLLRQSRGLDPAEVTEENLALPALDSRIGSLAERLTAGSTTRYDKVVALERWLSDELQYTLNVEDFRFDDPLTAFLFEGMAGHCEYFATSMVVLSRSAGIPARLVTGYLRGETNRFNRRHRVRQSDAHAWVEVHFPGSGWVSFDPTPAVGRLPIDRAGLADFASDFYATVERWWDDYLIGVDLQDQMTRLESIRDAVVSGAAALRGRLGPLFVGLLVAVPLYWAVRRGVRLRVARTPAERSGERRPPWFYRRLLALLAEHGLVRQPQETGTELARRAAAQLTPVAGTRVHQLTALYQRVRFDGSTTPAEVRRLADSLLSELRHSRP